MVTTRLEEARGDGRSPRLLFFGIDGADDGLVRRLVGEGRMPALGRLIERGASGPLRSTFPPHTAPAWTSIFTGVRPGEHGIYQFWETQSPMYRPRVLGSGDWRWEPVWRSLERHGLRVGVVNVPMTHPPVALTGGFMISWPLARTIHYASPPELIRELAASGAHYHSDLVTMYRGQEDYPRLAAEYVEGRTTAVLHLLRSRPVDALFVVYSEVDRVSHHFWGDGEAPRDEVLGAYELVDAALAEVVDAVPDDCFVVVASDHGFGRCSANLQVNELLEQAGLCATKLVAEVGHDGSPRTELDVDATAGWFTSSSRYVRTIDWERTRAYMPAPGCFGINFNLRGRQQAGCVDEAETAAVVAAVEEAVASTATAARPALSVVPREDVYQGRSADAAPDLLLVPGPWDVMPHPGLAGELWSAPTQEAIHRTDGILTLHGTGVAGGALRSDAGVEDVTPTLLALLDLPIQEGVDGRPLIGDGAYEVEPRQRVDVEVGSALSADDEKLVESRLRKMGYV